MNSGIPALESAYHYVIVTALIILAIMVFLCLIRSIMGPRVSDRIISVNMMGTLIMVIIALLAVKMKEGYLADICLIYAMISFLAVIVLCKVYMGVYLEKKKKEEEEKDDNSKLC